MVTDSIRRDTERNRRRLIDAARAVIARSGPDVPFDDIAAEAGVSRTTLHRHFSTRDHLFAQVFAENVDQIEVRALGLGNRPDGLIELFHFALDVQFAAPSLSRVLSRRRTEDFTELAARTAAAFKEPFDRALQSGLVHPTTSLRDIMLALPMAGAAVIEDDRAGRPRETTRIRALLHRGLFTTPPPLRADTAGDA